MTARIHSKIYVLANRPGRQGVSARAFTLACERYEGEPIPDEYCWACALLDAADDGAIDGIGYTMNSISILLDHPVRYYYLEKQHEQASTAK